MYSYEKHALERAGYSEVKFEYMVNDCKQFKVFKSGEGYTAVRVKKIADSDQFEIITDWDYPQEKDLITNFLENHLNVWTFMGFGIVLTLVTWFIVYIYTWLLNLQ